MKIYKIKDNSCKEKKEFSHISRLINKIADKTLEQLEKEGIFIFPELLKETDDLIRNQFVLKSLNNKYKTENIMGFLSHENEHCIIESRFSGDEHDFFFQYLLEKVFDIPNIVDMEVHATYENTIFDLLLFLFPYYLKKAMRKGIFKTYICKKYNDNNVKGKIDINRHIKENTPFLGNIAYNQREFSYDNYLTELIRHTIEFIKQKKYGNYLLNKVKEEVYAIINITKTYKICDKKKIIFENINNNVSHAYYNEYRILQQLCLLILKQQKHQIGCGEKKVYGVLFDGAWLWEEYIYQLVEDIFYHPMNKIKKDTQYLFTDNQGAIYPDFISKDYKNRIIADAKYKPKNNIGNKDYLQLVAYMFRFDSKQGFYFYPDTKLEDTIPLILNDGSSYENIVCSRKDITLVKLGLKIPENAKTYCNFVNQIKIAEENFKTNLIKNSKVAF